MEGRERERERERTYKHNVARNIKINQDMLPSLVAKLLTEFTLRISL